MGSTFDAAALDDLRFNFEKFRPVVPEPDHPDHDRLKRLADEEWSGTIPEPTDEQIERLFNDRLPTIRLDGQRTLAELNDRQTEGRRAWWREQPHEDGASEPTRDELYELDVPTAFVQTEQADYIQVSAELRVRQKAATLDAFAEFTGGHPSRDVLEALPWRTFQHFTGWLTGQFRPEAFATAISG